MLIVDGSLVGSKPVMDLRRADKVVTLIDNAVSTPASLMSTEVSSRLQHRLTEMGVHLLLKSQLQGSEKTDSDILATLDRQRCIEVGAVVAAAGLRPETALARRAGLTINHGAYVDSYLQTSNADIYALGDYVEINSQVSPFLQPIQLSAVVSAKNLLGNNTPLKFPVMLVEIETPELPLHLAGKTQRQDLRWQINIEHQGMIAHGVDDADQPRAFVVSEDRMKEASGLLKTLPMQVSYNAPNVGCGADASHPTYGEHARQSRNTFMSHPALSQNVGCDAGTSYPTCGDEYIGRIRRSRRTRQWCPNAARFIRSGLPLPANASQQ